MKHIFVDMDGVLTDFDQQLADLLDKKLEREWDFGNDPKVWEKINHAGEKFWSTMGWMLDGKELWNVIKKYKPTILTAPSNHPSSKEGKKTWLKRELPKTPYIIESKKEKYADKDSILIDDREDNIKKWEEAGGIAIHHKDAKSTIKELEKIMENKDKQAGYTVSNGWVSKDGVNWFQQGNDITFTSNIDYSKYLSSTPRDGGEYYTLSIPKNVVPPLEGVNLNVDGVDLIVFSVSTPEDMAKGRGGTVARSMLENGIGWRVNCLPSGHEHIRQRNMRMAISKIDDMADKLEAMGRIKEALHLDKIADKFEEFLKAEKGLGGPGTTVMDQPRSFEPTPVPIRGYLWKSGDKRLQTVKEVLNNIDRGKTNIRVPVDKKNDLSYILNQIRKISATSFPDQQQVEVVKKDLVNKAFGIHSDIAQLINLLFTFEKDRAKILQNEDDINRIAVKYLTKRRTDPFETSAPDPFSRTFHQLARRIDRTAYENMSEEHKNIVRKCLIKIASAIEANIYKIADYDAYGSREATEQGLINYFVSLIDYLKKGKKTIKDIADKVMYGMTTWPITSPDKKKAIAAAWKEALSRVARTPEEILELVKSFKLNSRELGALPFDMESWSRMTGVPVMQFAKIVDENALKSYG